MRIAVIVAGLTVSLVAATAASSATRPETSMGVAAVGGTSNEPLGGSAGLLVIAEAMHGVVPKHHPMYHHFKHRYRTPTKSR
jgi:hypothetical protein